jgi:hypothetical protein
MKATMFMRQPFYVAGHLVTEDNMDAIAKWCQGHVIRDGGRSFIRVPVDRPTNKRQTEAYAGTWVTLSKQREERSFKVYTEEWLEKNFIRLPDDDLYDIDIDIPSDCDVPSCMIDHSSKTSVEFQAPAS